MHSAPSHAEQPHLLCDYRNMEQKVNWNVTSPAQIYRYVCCPMHNLCSRIGNLGLTGDWSAIAVGLEQGTELAGWAKRSEFGNMENTDTISAGL